MKQNFRIMFHFILKRLKNRYYTLLIVGVAVSLGGLTNASEKQPEYLQLFDPAKDFKPALRDLTEVFPELAGRAQEYHPTR